MAAVLVAIALVIVVAVVAGGSRSRVRHRAHIRAQARTRTIVAAPVGQVREMTLGTSVGHRSIRAVVLGDPRRPHPILVVGCVHGNEPGGIRIVDELIHRGPVAGQTFWLIPDLNPDGVAADTRQNAHGVDLNRNFPYRWRATYQPGDQQYQGPRPLSEPESTAAARLILRIAPRIAIWFHQPLGVTDLSGGDPRVERAFASRSGLPPRELTRYRGSAVGWQDHVLPGTTAFVVELPPGRPSARAVAREADAVRGLAAAFTG